MDKLVVIVVLVILGIGLAHGATTTSLCTQTPYPELCNSLVVTKPNLATTHETQFELRELALQTTLDKAERAHGLVAAMDVTSFDQRAKLAWADCMELYEDAVDKLNRSLGSTDQSSAQTWLSAAMTNQQTCRNGFIDYNLSSYLNSFPVVLSDFSKMLSNLLAINKAAAPSVTALSSTKKTRSRRLLSDGFPEWVSAGDRKLLQVSGGAPAADVVVAQDGSGNYKTISEAVAASKNSGGKRFVIHVKAGVYKENVVIKRSMKNLMLVGDGIGATIVTGNKNAEDGSTTFASATFGPGFDVPLHIHEPIAEEMSRRNIPRPTIPTKSSNPSRSRSADQQQQQREKKQKLSKDVPPPSASPSVPFETRRPSLLKDLGCRPESHVDLTGGPVEAEIPRPFSPSYTMADGRVLLVKDSVKEEPNLAVTLLRGLALPRDYDQVPTELLPGLGEMCSHLVQVCL
ncbi:hypothetical protein RHGRI_026668 [Rhododendron griersonianum]|uniref:Pectinesterase n=1 Tax=Rhododendron griersonianum TaxID=479676 RepID=A0AAV6ITQ1_9ERIC|nr:hypothetical protein RHGRI_026668 [Rhododendron griersonianum]